MNTAVKVGLWAAGIGVLLWIGKKSTEAVQFVQGLTYRITGFGTPKISSQILSVPLRVAITNPTATSLQVDNVNISLSILQKNTYKVVGGANVNQVSVAPGVTTKEFVAQIDLRALTSNFLDTLNTIAQSSALSVKADVLVTIKGVTLPAQTITRDLRV